MLKISVLVDNNTLIDRYFLGEPAVSYFIETENAKVLFDVGYSDAFWRNAQQLRLDPWSTDWLVLSHGHIDHTGGIDALLKVRGAAQDGTVALRRPRLLAHPHALLPKYLDERTPIGMSVTRDSLEAHFELHLSTQPVWLDRQLVFLGQIPRASPFEAGQPLGYRIDEAGGRVPDDLLDDTALAYAGSDGLCVITGCSHAGICNIIAQARRVTGIHKVLDVIGGFHLLRPSPEQLAGTVACFAELSLPRLHACHCTDLPSRMALGQTATLEEVGSGQILEYTATGLRPMHG
ncbi:MAG: MBL fold metallo-hydrolase [Polyangiaceae bacterium]|nr:MBL fold metallo-hydrolase [Polyangiaceae bacterium]